MAPKKPQAAPKPGKRRKAPEVKMGYTEWQRRNVEAAFKGMTGKDFDQLMRERSSALGRGKVR